MSRAAKKRAKKKKKQSQDQQPEPREKKHTLIDNDNDESKERIKKSNKHELEMEEQKVDSTVERKKKKLIKQVSETEEQKVESMVHNILSKLTPAKILQMQKLDPEEEHIFLLVDQQEISALDFLKKMTTRQRASALFQSILGQKVSLEEFYELYWEQKPLFVSSHDETRLDGFLSKDSIRDLLETHPMYYGRDLNVTRYEEGTDGIKRRITLDPQPDTDEEFVLANAKDAWANFGDGCTLRLLCPHKHNDALHALLSTLEWEWGCMVGANVYLTPPAASQGFAPHYDDIEAFCLQLEGYKHWKVYAPFNKAEILPRVSSPDYTEEDLKGVEPVLDVVLGPGDLLYLPRGWIHQACTTDRKGHSLHLTVSTMQQWSWVDYLELLMPEALEAAAASNTSTSLREGLPLRFLDYMGAIHDEANMDELPDGLKQLMDDNSKKVERVDSGEDSERSHRLRKIQAMREEFREAARKRIMRVSKEALSMLDAACDQMGKRFISDRLPPAFTATEMASTSESRTENGGKIFPNTLCRLARPGIARLALEEGKAVLYHCVDNSRVYQGNPLSPMEFEMDDAPALELLLTTVEPRWIQVQDLIHDDIEEKMEITQALYDEGILSILQMEKPDRSVQVG